MKTLFKTFAIAATLFGLFTVYAVPAQADTQNATQNSTITVNCTSGDYGQSNNCYAINNQSITQNQYANRNLLYKHIPVATALDLNLVLLTVGAVVIMTTGAIVAYNKIRA